MRRQTIGFFKNYVGGRESGIDVASLQGQRFRDGQIAVGVWMAGAPGSRAATGSVTKGKGRYSTFTIAAARRAVSRSVAATAATSSPTNLNARVQHQ